SPQSNSRNHECPEQQCANWLAKGKAGLASVRESQIKGNADDPVNSTFAVANREPASPAHSAARFRALLGSSASLACTSLGPDTPGPDCNEENAGARSA